jgi:hypothetical protein
VNIGQGEAGVGADAQLETHPIELPWRTIGGSSGPHEDHRPKEPSERRTYQARLPFSPSTVSRRLRATPSSKVNEPYLRTVRENRLAGNVPARQLKTCSRRSSLARSGINLGHENRTE